MLSFDKGIIHRHKISYKDFDKEMNPINVGVTITLDWITQDKTRKNVKR